GEGRATWVLPSEKKLAAWKHYLAHAKALCGGKIIIDAGAVKALKTGGKSLLASGIKNVEGYFNEKDLVQILDEAQKEIARGLVNYSSGDLVQIQGRSSKDIQPGDDHHSSGVVIHRDNLVLTV
ncbi:glutamate 5-kinase, partial [bacterium]|nr:glutamate 5-kinase [bacterium]